MEYLLLAADFSVIKPDFGLLFWTSVIFLLFWFLVGRFAFRPIAEALKKREDDIQDALDSAKNARDEMATLKAENEAILAEAREERTKILREAKDTKERVIKEAQEDAKVKARKIVEDATRDIENMKNAAVNDLKNQAGIMAIEIAEKVLRRELDEKPKQEAFVNNLVKEVKLN